MRAAFEAWQAGKGQGKESEARARIAGETRSALDSKAIQSKRSTNKLAYDNAINTPDKESFTQ